MDPFPEEGYPWAMSPRPWYRRNRSLTLDRRRDVQELLEQLRGVHPPSPDEGGRVWRYAVILSTVAALYVPFIMTDLGAGPATPGQQMGLLSLVVVAVVCLSFFILSTHTHTYIFGEEGVTCRDRHEEERWFIACREIEAVSVLRLQGGRFYLYLIERESGRQLAVHSHASISQEVGALALVQSAFGERSGGPPPESDH